MKKVVRINKGVQSGKRYTKLIKMFEVEVDKDCLGRYLNLLYASFHRQDNACYALCNTSCGELTDTRNSTTG